MNSAAFFAQYANRLRDTLATADLTGVVRLAEALRSCWSSRRRLFLCGNGGSAANAMHLANDFIYGVSKEFGRSLDATALSANASVLTCLANDLGYEHIFSYQLSAQASRGDVLIALSGSGNSPNIISALEKGRAIGVKSFAILGYSGGRAKVLADDAIHFAVDDMQIAEDLQLVVGHMVMQWLYKNPPRAET